ncbi:hypothetical protein O9K51_10266 [Purpureocillium lavendulum]|uniref:Zn(2)-C6 fungal-type domain-containing protein n=1 Tax=Purpureocillium lavendulum TaxID=1247861 RepID=A0AB34FEC1_9HYPO|nr:hypothetical protein O9K51_10266 [Purpureocillium lavendulum]
MSVLMSGSPEGHASSRASRRKACDLCFKKKIKCDMVQPVCSNCVLYKTECRTSIIRRKGPPPKAKAQPPAALPEQPPSETSSAPDSTEDRLSRIERQLQQIIDITKSRADTQFSPLIVDDDSASASNATPEGAGSTNDRSNAAETTSSVQCYCPADEFPLPPIDEVVPIVNHYFSIFNLVVPLFEQKAFMELLSNFYQGLSRTKAAWAAIQVVLSLSLRTATPEQLQDSGGPDRFHRANLYLKNAQSVVSDLVTREDDLLGIQVLLGIVMLFQNSSDPKPASVVIGTAMRLAHRLRLHTEEATKHFTAEENLQRSRIFWIAYTFDKDISLRITAPSIQSDADIDVPLPSLTVSDGIGLIWTQDGSAHFNYHRLRVDLAHIEGQIYDQLCSNRASRVPPEERKRRVCRLQIQLNRWYERVPLPFQIEHAASNLAPTELVIVTKMHHAYLLATVMTHGLYSHNAEWLKLISSRNQGAIEDLAQAMDSCATKTPQGPPFPGGWSRCVELSRGCMELFEKSTLTECLVWQCCCPHFSGLIVLLANMLIKPSHEHIALDQHLTTKAIQLFDKLLEFSPSKSIQKIRDVVGRLYERAFEEVGRVAAERAEADANTAFTSPPIDLFSDSAKDDFFMEGIKISKPDFAPAGFDPFSWERMSTADWGWAFDAAQVTPP